MFIISSNLTTRNPAVREVLAHLGSGDPGQKAAKELEGLVTSCVAGGADALEIDLQQHGDRPEVMAAAVNSIQRFTDRRLCLSTKSPEALEAGLLACKRSPIVNHISVDEKSLGKMLPMIARHGAGVVFLVSEPSRPSDAEEMLGKAAVLIGAAREVGIASDAIFVDPGMVHITADAGQRHLVEIKEFLRVFSTTFDPAIRSTCWIANASAGAPSQARPFIETAVLAVLSGLGLSSVFLDILSPEHRRLVRLLKVIDNELVYADSVLELQRA